MRTSKVRNDTKSSDGAIKHGSIELCNNVSATTVTRNNNQRSQVSGTHLPIEGLLDDRVSDQDEVAQLEVVVVDGPGMNLLESSSSPVTSVKNSAMKSIEVLVALL